MSPNPPIPPRQAAELDGMRQRASDIVTAVHHHGLDHASALMAGLNGRQLMTLVLATALAHPNPRLPGPTDLRTMAQRERSAQRIALEDSRWTDEEARRAHRMYESGVRHSAKVMEGNRVYCRRLKRARREASESEATG